MRTAASCRLSGRASRDRRTGQQQEVPSGIAADVAAKLNQEIAATLREPETQERLAKLGLVVVASPQSGLTEVLQRDVPKWGKAVKDSGAVAE
jgi:tripartite-type tricarboxylate transporter receptor subunit TctC